MTNSNTGSRLSKNILIASILLGLGFATAVFAETVYIWRDSNGVRQYSDACPTGETCRTREIGTLSKKRQERWRDRVANSTSSGDTTDTSSTSSGGGSTSGDSTVGGDTGGTTSTGGSTTTTGDTSTEPTPEDSGGTTTAGDTTTDTPTDTPTDNTALLEWDPVNSSDLAGYRVYHAVAGGTYPAFGSGINAGSSNSITISRLDSGTRYYFRVTAVDKTGNESGFSNEVYKDIP